MVKPLLRAAIPLVLVTLAGCQQATPPPPPPTPPPTVAPSPTPTPLPTKITAYQPKTGDKFCVYTVMGSPAGKAGPLKFGGFGSQTSICVLCPAPAPAVCAIPGQLTPVDEIVYDVVPFNSPAATGGTTTAANSATACRPCPSANTYK